MTRIPKDAASELPLEGLGEFTGEFIVSRKEDLKILHCALKTDDFSAIRRICHTWRGFAVPYGFGELVQFADELEVSCEKKDRHQCQELLNEIASYLSSK